MSNQVEWKECTAVEACWECKHFDRMGTCYKSASQDFEEIDWEDEEEEDDEEE